MAKTVYVLGAGINRAMSRRMDDQDFYPPLATDFFQQTLRYPEFVQTYEGYYAEVLNSLFDYISKHWKLSKDDLQRVPFDLEALYTLIQLQALEAEKDFHEASPDSVNQQKAQEHFWHLNSLEHGLTAFLAEYLSKFPDHRSYPWGSSNSLERFGEIIYSQRAAVLTFNYDLILERKIESASGRVSRDGAYYRWLREAEVTRRELAEEEWKQVLIKRKYNWSLPLAYGAEFDWVNVSDLDWVNVPDFGHRRAIPKEKFYAYPENELCEVPFLKLHGSLNWFEYARVPDASTDEVRGEGPYVIEEGQASLDERSYSGDDIHSPMRIFTEAQDGFFLRPLLITPVLHKNLGDRPFIREIWKRARQELSQCETLIVGGYSFPPTDFHTRRLFLEAFAEHTPEEVIVINPDTRVVQLVKDLCHFQKPVLVCSNLGEYNALHSHSGTG